MGYWNKTNVNRLKNSYVEHPSSNFTITEWLRGWYHTHKDGTSEYIPESLIES